MSISLTGESGVGVGVGVWLALPAASASFGSPSSFSRPVSRRPSRSYEDLGTLVEGSQAAGLGKRVGGFGRKIPTGAIKGCCWGFMLPGAWLGSERTVFTCVLKQTEDIRQGMFGGGGPGSCLIIQLFRSKYVARLVAWKLPVIL